MIGPTTRARQLCRLAPLSPPRSLRREKMIEIFGAELPPRMTVQELRQALLDREDLAVPPSTVALVRGFWGHRWMAEHDPDYVLDACARKVMPFLVWMAEGRVLTDVLMDRLSRRVGGYRCAA